MKTSRPETKLDGYKLGHPDQYPPNTQFVQSGWTARGSRNPLHDHVVKFGEQAFLIDLQNDWMENFFCVPFADIEKRYTARLNGYLGPQEKWSNVARLNDLWELKYLPLEFHSLPEGSLVPLRVPMLIVENTHEDFGWMTNSIETLMSCSLWLPSTSATTAYYFRKMLNEWAEKTGGDKDFVGWQGHDFSMRGMSSYESALVSGAAHLISFNGTDTVPALDWIEEYYGGYPDDYLIGGSVPATEHSVMCAGGKESELETFSRLLDTYPSGILSVVSDTWDLWKVITEILPQLKDKIMARPGKLVIRPDSGVPELILAGDPDATPGSPANLGVIQLLWNLFGGTFNELGYKVLDDHIGVIYGDSINYDRGNLIEQMITDKGFHAERDLVTIQVDVLEAGPDFVSTTPVLGIGSFCYQLKTRDEYNFAMKATYAKVDGEDHDLFKDPVTDDGMKKSATGRQAVGVDENGEYYLIERATPEQEKNSALELSWRNGEMIRKPVTFQEVRQNLWGV